VALATTVDVVTPKNFINAVGKALCTVTETAGVVAEAAKETPETVAGKLTVTVSALVPNPLYWA
jgi:hypothetical protein